MKTKTKTYVLAAFAYISFFAMCLAAAFGDQLLKLIIK